MKRILGILLPVLMIGLFCQPVYAETGAVSEKPWEKFSISLGGFIHRLTVICGLAQTALL
jgi:hypothetical protein